MPGLSVRRPRAGNRAGPVGAPWLRRAGEGAGFAHSTTREPGPLAYRQALIPHFTSAE